MKALIARANIKLGWVIFLLLSVTFSRAADWNSESAPEYDSWFQKTHGWIGADGDFTVALTNGLTLWLFSDTFVGEVRDGHRVNATMINNSAAWQHGLDAQPARVEFFHGKSSDGKPRALITPADGKGWFWLFDGVLANGKLFLFLSQFERTEGNSAFSFQHIGLWLGEVSNPFAPPTEWQMTQRKIPFATFGSRENRLFGSALLQTHGFIYIFGASEVKQQGQKMILARAPETRLADFQSWQFRTATGWSTNVEEIAPLCESVATEYSVTWLPALEQFVLICTENGMSEKIIARTATKPWGPWSAAKVVYRCPEPTWSKNVFTYAAKAHPMLATNSNELLLTYAANSFDFEETLKDPRLYWPRFVRVKISNVER